MPPALFLLGLFAGTVSPPPCIAAPTAPALDHAILAVTNLERAAAGFTASGFRLKGGRLHPNGLLNRHVKFRDATSIELMTVRGRAGDSLARDYARLLLHAEGGVFVGLTISDLALVERAAARAGLAAQHRASGSMGFVSFAERSPAAAVFFGRPGPSARDPDSLVTHAVAVEGLAEAWIEGGETLEALLAAVGAAACGSAQGPDGRAGNRWALARGTIVVVPPASPNARPRVLGVVLRGGVAAWEPDTLMRPHPAFWVRVQRDAR